MALEANAVLRIGERVYGPRDRLTDEHEAELRARPMFGLLLENGRVIETDGAPEDDSPRDDDSGASTRPDVSTRTDAPRAPDETTKTFRCTVRGCDYAGPSKSALSAHVYRNHKRKKRK